MKRPNRLATWCISIGFVIALASAFHTFGVQRAYAYTTLAQSGVTVSNADIQASLVRAGWSASMAQAGANLSSNIEDIPGLLGIYNGSCCTGVLQMNVANLAAFCGCTSQQYAEMGLDQQVNAWVKLTNSALKTATSMLSGMTTFDGQQVDDAFRLACAQLGTGNCQKMLKGGTCASWHDGGGTTICTMANKIRTPATGSVSSNSGGTSGNGTGVIGNTTTQPQVYGDGAMVSAGPAMSAGCDPNVLAALNNASEYSAYQTTQTALSIVKQPNSFAACLQPLMQMWQQVMNMFNGTGSITSFLTSFATSLVNSLINQLMAAACAAIQSTMNGLTDGMQITQMAASVLGSSTGNMYNSGSTNAQQNGTIYVGGSSSFGSNAPAGSLAEALNTGGGSITNSTTAGGGFLNNTTPQTPAAGLRLQNPDIQLGGPAQVPVPAGVPTQGLGTGAMAKNNGNTAPSQTCGPGPHGGHVAVGYQNASGGSYCGANQWCYSLVATYCPSIGNTTGWSKGILVKGNGGQISPGTVIATFAGNGGTSYNAPALFQHTALYLSQNSQGILVLQQWPGHTPRMEYINFGHSGVLNGDLYYVVQ